MSIQRKWGRRVTEIVDAEWPDYAIQYTGGSHIKITLRKGVFQRIVFCSSSPSDRRAELNIRGEVRRAAQTLREISRKHTK